MLGIRDLHPLNRFKRVWGGKRKSELYPLRTCIPFERVLTKRYRQISRSRVLRAFRPTSATTLSSRRKQPETRLLGSQKGNANEEKGQRKKYQETNVESQAKGAKEEKGENTKSLYPIYRQSKDFIGCQSNVLLRIKRG